MGAALHRGAPCRTRGEPPELPGLLEEGERQFRAGFGPITSAGRDQRRSGPGQPVPPRPQRAAAGTERRRSRGHGRRRTGARARSRKSRYRNEADQPGQRPYGLRERGRRQRPRAGCGGGRSPDAEVSEHTLRRWATRRRCLAVARPATARPSRATWSGSSRFSSRAAKSGGSGATRRRAAAPRRQRPRGTAAVRAAVHRRARWVRAPGRDALLRVGPRGRREEDPHAALALIARTLVDVLAVRIPAWFMQFDKALERPRVAAGAATRPKVSRPRYGARARREVSPLVGPPPAEREMLRSGEPLRDRSRLCVPFGLGGRANGCLVLQGRRRPSAGGRPGPGARPGRPRRASASTACRPTGTRPAGGRIGRCCTPAEHDLESSCCRTCSKRRSRGEGSSTPSAPHRYSSSGSTRRTRRC